MFTSILFIFEFLFKDQIYKASKNKSKNNSTVNKPNQKSTNGENINDEYDCLTDDLNAMDCISGADPVSTSSSTSHLDSNSNTDDHVMYKSVPCIQISNSESLNEDPNNSSKDQDKTNNDEEEEDEIDDLEDGSNEPNEDNNNSKLDIIVLEDKDRMSRSNIDNNSVSSSSVSINDHSVICLD
jgi:hypothetical protein